MQPKLYVQIDRSLPEMDGDNRKCDHPHRTWYGVRPRMVAAEEFVAWLHSNQRPFETARCMSRVGNAAVR
ncbi:signal peptidase I [Anopheles sinensis]|uniref:Signal peptidase I n=1 Tax=Anopheles sinensis TaxID=74873 RepID=A0A084WLS3_ANOSI|nr:signal peptidase I [Anopheles sinensis]